MLSRRNRDTLAAAARVLIPPGGSIPWGADDVDVAGRLARDVDGWPPRVRRQIRLFLTAFEFLPLASGRRHTFSRLSPDEQGDFLEKTYHHRSASRRLLVTLLKQMCFVTYLSVPDVEEAIGYRYECQRPRAGVSADPKEQIHH